MHRKLRLACPLAVAAVLAASPGHAADPRMRALVVGIDDYQHEMPLGGAVADARDIEATLKALGAETTQLLDLAATRANIEAEWNRIVAASAEGDTIVFTYAGHGGQEPDKAPLDEIDGFDEAFLLAMFNPDPRTKGFNERLTDDAIHDWLKMAEAKGVKVIFVADSCHSGTMTRGVDPRAKAGERGSPPYGLPQGTSIVDHEKAAREAAAKLPASALAREEEFKNVLFLSATQEQLKAPEIVIENQRRGALSYAFARAFEGRADANRDGTLTRMELERYVARQVRQISDARQVPDLKPRSGADAPLFPVPSASSPGEASLPTIRLAVLGGSAELQQTLGGSLKGAEIVLYGTPADLIYDAAKREIVTGNGDPVAQDVNADQLQGTVDAWRVLPALKTLAVSNPADIKVEPDDGRHAQGEKIAIASEAALGLPNVVAINLAPNGELRLLYPIPTDNPVWPMGKNYRVSDIDVTPPFGTDHILLIAADKSLAELLPSIAKPHAHVLTMPTTELPDRLAKALTGAKYKVGLTGVFTSRTRSE